MMIIEFGGWVLDHCVPLKSCVSRTFTSSIKITNQSATETP